MQKLSFGALALMTALAVMLIGLSCSRDNPSAPDGLPASTLAQNLYVDPYGFEALDPDFMWKDGFEDYVVGSFPSGWVPDGNGGKVVDAVSRQGTQSLWLFGLHLTHSQWAGMAYHALSATPPFEIKAWVRNGDEDLVCPWPGRGWITLRVGTSWVNPSRTLLGFTLENTIIGSTGTVLQDYDPLTWYAVKIRYERLNVDQMMVTYWIDHVEVGSVVLPEHEYEEDLTTLELAVLEGSAWFDGIMVFDRD